MNAVSSANVDAARYVYIVEDPFEVEFVRGMRNVPKDDQPRVLAVVKAIGNGSLSVAEANAAVAAGRDAVLALADRLAA